MKYQEIAAEIVEKIGGTENVTQLEHCSTRLRFNVQDKQKVDVEGLKKISGILGVIINAQVQVIVGNDVVEVYDEVLKLGNFSGQTASNEPTEKQKLSTVFLEFLVGVFQPLVPAIAGAGILKSLLILLATIGWLPNTSETYILFASISDATFYFLPLMVAVTTATRLNVNRIVAVAAVGTLLLPNNVAALADGFHIFGLAVKPIAYNGQIFPAILCVLLLGYLEKQVNKISPKPIRVFFVPMVALAITVPLTFLVLGPLGFTLGQGLTAVILFIQSKLGFVSVALVSAILPLMVVIGMHKALFPYALSSLAEIGFEMLYLPASFVHNLSEAGACFAVMLKTKDKEFKSVAASAGISAFMGITEPALFGVTMLHKKVLYAVMASGLISGGVIGLLGIKSFVAAGAGVANLTMFIDPDNAMNIVYGMIALVMSLALGFVFTLLFWKEETDEVTAFIQETEKRDEAVFGNGTVTIGQPITGEVIALTAVTDELFATKTLGDGIAIIPSIGELRAPVDGTIEMVFETGHAIGMKTKEGIELLFHLGINTVELQGQFFSTKVKPKETVKSGDLLATFDVAAIKAAGFDITSPIVVTNSNQYLVQFAR